MFNNINFILFKPFIISQWLIISIILWPILNDNMSNSAIITSVLLLCDIIRNINKELRTLIADFQIITGRIPDTFCHYIMVFFTSILNPILFNSSIWLFFLSQNRYSPLRLYLTKHVFYMSIIMYIVCNCIQLCKKKWLKSLDKTETSLIHT
jgi:hypothetical protein